MDNGPIYCRACGTINEEATELLAEKEGALRDLELDMRKARSRNSNAVAERNAQQKLSPFRDDCCECFDYWKQQISPNAREFNGDRFAHVEARLKARHTVEEIKLAIDGAKARPWKGGKTDLDTICKNEKNLLMFIDFGEKAKRAPARPNPQMERLYARMLEVMTPRVVERLGELRGWTPEAIRKLGVGFDPSVGRVVFPSRDAFGTLVGFSRYQPNPDKRNGQPKNIAEGKRELFPPPEEFATPTVWLVEGEPDTVAMTSMGYPTIGVPGVSKWPDGWAERFGRFDQVRIVFDCDEAGKQAADARSAQLSKVTDVKVLEIDPNRDDGYDVNDLLVEVGPEAAAKIIARLGGSAVVRIGGPDPSEDPRTPIERVTEALEAHDCRPKTNADGEISARCPAHDDRVASLSVGVGDDGRVLLHCHTGCKPEEIVSALGLTWKEMFAAA
jgi:hypothetical protein